MTNARQSLGRWGEAKAEEYLLSKGYSILGRNVRTPYGEIDLIAAQESEFEGSVVVFVEVKTRSNRRYGYPEDSITVRKQAHLLNACQHYLQENPELDCDWRIDVIAIQRGAHEAAPHITHFENAVGPE